MNRPGAVPEVRRTGEASTSTDDAKAARSRADAVFGKFQLQFRERNPSGLRPRSSIGFRFRKLALDRREQRLNLLDGLGSI